MANCSLARSRSQTSSAAWERDYMDWVHCNRCWVRPTPNSGRHFLLSECGHIFCSECQQRDAGRATAGLCLVCGAQKSAIKLTSRLGKSVLPFFSQPAQLLGSLSAALQFQLQVQSRRQSEHRRKLAVIARIWQLRAPLERMRTTKAKLLEQLGRSQAGARPPGAATQTPPQRRDPSARTPATVGVARAQLVPGSGARLSTHGLSARSPSGAQLWPVKSVPSSVGLPVGTPRQQTRVQLPGSQRAAVPGSLRLGIGGVASSAAPVRGAARWQ